MKILFAQVLHVRKHLMLIAELLKHLILQLPKKKKSTIEIYLYIYIYR